MLKRLLAISLILALMAAGGKAVLPDPSKEDYTVGPRDKLYINLWGEENMEAEVTVSGQGTITYFFLNEVYVAGLTVDQIKAKLTRLLQNGYYRNPVVTVRILEYKSKEVQILGQVDKPGTYALDTNYTTLVRLISLAGGTKENRGNYAYIYRGGVFILRQQEEKAPHSTETAPPPENKPEAPGGTAPSSKSEKEKKDKTPPPKDEPPSVLAGKDRIQVDLRLLLDEGDLSVDVPVYPGDFVWIGSVKSEETSKNFVWVEGAVKYPKPVDWQPGLTVLQAIIQAGGFSDIAAPNRTTLTRMGPNGTQVVIRVRVKDIQKGKMPDVPVLPGDRITVPESIF